MKIPTPAEVDFTLEALSAARVEEALTKIAHAMLEGKLSLAIPGDLSIEECASIRTKLESAGWKVTYRGPASRDQTTRFTWSRR